MRNLAELNEAADVRGTSVADLRRWGKGPRDGEIGSVFGYTGAVDTTGETARRRPAHPGKRFPGAVDPEQTAVAVEQEQGIAAALEEREPVEVAHEEPGVRGQESGVRGQEPFC